MGELDLEVSMKVIYIYSPCTNFIDWWVIESISLSKIKCTNYNYD